MPKPATPGTKWPERPGPGNVDTLMKHYVALDEQQMTDTVFARMADNIPIMALTGMLQPARKGEES